MAVRNTTDANVFWNGQRVAKFTDITPSVTRQTLDDTGIGQFADTYVYGGTSSTLSGTLLYDPLDAATTALMNRIQSVDPAPDTMRLVSKSGDVQGDIEGIVLIGQQSVSVAVRGLMSIQVSMVVSGGFNGAW